MKTKTKRLLALALSAAIALSSAAFAALAEGVATPPEASAQPTPGEEQGEIQEGEQDVAIEVTDPVELPVIPTQEPDETAEPEEPEDPEETGAPDETIQPEETAQPEPSEEPAPETPAYESAYAYVAAGTILYADPQRTIKLGTLAAEAALRAKNVGEYAHGSVYEVLFDTYQTAGTGRWETAYFYTSNIRRLTEAQTDALTSERIVNGAKVLYAEFTYYVEPEADEGEDVEPEETTEPAESAEPEETAEPAESAEPEEEDLVFNPAKTAEPAQSAEPAENSDPDEEDIIFIPIKAIETLQPAEGESEEEDVAPARDEAMPATERSVHIQVNSDTQTLQIGSRITLNAELAGYEGVDYTFNWQHASADRDGNVIGEWQTSQTDTLSFTYELTEDNLLTAWRMSVTVHE